MAAALTPESLVSKWSKVQLAERQASHEHFLDLCHLLNQPTPAEDATGEDYCFEKHVKVVGSASTMSGNVAASPGNTEARGSISLSTTPTAKSANFRFAILLAKGYVI